MKEYDYPAGNQPVYTSYSGTGGISISNYLRRIAFAWRFGDLQLMLQNPITSDSRILFHRTIQERVQTIFPFLTYDTDPYLVVSEGKQYWMLDAYSVSNKYPYSKPLEDSDVNYMRNAAKVVIDAYNGDVHYYMADVNDPIVKTYAKIFPGVFRPMSSMPVGLVRSHVRYPETLFKVQANVLLTYHMKSPQTFYNKGDLWAIPNEIVQTSGQSDANRAILRRDDAARRDSGGVPHDAAVHTDQQGQHDRMDGRTERPQGLRQDRPVPVSEGPVDLWSGAD